MPRVTDDPPPPAEPPVLSRRAVLYIVAAAGLVTTLIFGLVSGSLTDDAYITLAYAKNVARDLHWGLIPQEVSNTATSPLNVLAIAAVTFILRITGGVHPIFALGVVSVVSAMVMAWGFTRIQRSLRLPTSATVLGFGLVLANPFLLSAIGLEVLLIPTLLVLLVALALEGRAVWFGVVAGLTLLTRLDLIVFVLAISLCAPLIRRRLLAAAGMAIAVSLPWFVFSWFYFGSAIPDTLAIKTLQAGLFGEWSFGNGPFLYADGRAIVTTLAFLPALLGLAALIGWLVLRLRGAAGERVKPLAPAAGLAIGGVAHYITYSLMEVGPYHWYYVPVLVSLSAWLAIAVGAWLGPQEQRAGTRFSIAGIAFGLVAMLAAGNAAVDVKQGIPWASPPIFGNWASADDYARMGPQLADLLDGQSVLSAGEIGTLAYYCECPIVDEFSDRGIVAKIVDKRIAEAGPVMKLLLRANYHNFDRTKQPRPVRYRLFYEPAPVLGVYSWRVYSAAKGVRFFTLVPVK